MVEDAIDDPKRIAQLLASELTGLATGPLAAVAVVDADQSATPSPGGTVAYSVTVGDRHLAHVLLYPDAAVVELDGDVLDGDDVSSAAPTDDGDAGFTVETDDQLQLHLSSGVAVKRAVDALRDALAAESGE